MRTAEPSDRKDGSVSVTPQNSLQETACRQAIPPTPPYTTAVQTELFSGTPHQPYSTVVNRYMTPPITPEDGHSPYNTVGNCYMTLPTNPEGEYFVNGNDIRGYRVLQCLAGLTPSNENSYPQALTQYRFCEQ
jgi:hypothetical protein